jgi:hypothetical protein
MRNTKRTRLYHVDDCLAFACFGTLFTKVEPTRQIEAALAAGIPEHVNSSYEYSENGSTNDLKGTVAENFFELFVTYC